MIPYESALRRWACPGKALLKVEDFSTLRDSLAASIPPTAAGRSTRTPSLRGTNPDGDC